ncbi:MAG: hypothetical protein AVDCRST_MAG88-3188 [uncultured Thermomicrobiales bacterium]|uniref:BPL/LPL catalytic domain-containing protein n=1 Tax=uncultured Thermomicrobiales bacterium TaxID=1645740 RepID=A0A6J4VHN3_9BACT|nr:MAG: hypothetical protein AVDCRST_MAG88-3188 [uncultured Thermomicrobiales bacterium]
MLQTRSLFPPLYSADIRLTGDAFAEAVRAAESGADPATLVWIDRPDRLDCAVVAHPDRPLAAALQVVYVAAIAVREAAGGLGPPEKPIHFAWPDQVLLDGGLIGGVRVAAGPGDLPDWLVVGVSIDIEGDLHGLDPGLRPDRTSLHEEGFGEVTAPEFAEDFARYFLLWTDRWLEEGTEPVHREWTARGPARGSAVAGKAARHRWQGAFEGLAPSDGALRLASGSSVALEVCLEGPSWAL